MPQRFVIRSQTLFLTVLVFVLVGGPLWAAQSGEQRPYTPHLYLAQIPYEPAIQPEYTPGEDATPAPEILTPKDQERLESLIPLLDGRQEFWAIGEFCPLWKTFHSLLSQSTQDAGISSPVQCGGNSGHDQGSFRRPRVVGGGPG